MAAQRLKTTCCVVGGGPAGMMLGFLLARAGVKVAVLEKHADFLRDFRGDTIHPSTMQLMHELGLLERSSSCRMRASIISAARSARPALPSPTSPICRRCANTSR